MGLSERYIIIHRGIVVSANADSAFVRIDVGATGRSCVGCALMASCGQDGKSKKEDVVVLSAIVPHGVDMPEPGHPVTVGLPKGNSLKAAMLMLALPLVVFLGIAVCGIRTGYSEGISAISALVAATVCYLIIYVIYRRRPTPWILIPDTK